MYPELQEREIKKDERNEKKKTRKKQEKQRKCENIFESKTHYVLFYFPYFGALSSFATKIRKHERRKKVVTACFGFSYLI